MPFRKHFDMARLITEPTKCMIYKLINDNIMYKESNRDDHR
jgi:hypothetical protein